MAENADRRKLAAILCADVKGYSKLMGEDESYTVGALKERRKLFAENIQNHGGRVVNAPGDSILAELPSVVSAVQCAVEIQSHIDDRNAELPDNRKMVFRIGVNLGDVIESEDAIYGDGVNIAARIEALADPGGVSISRTVFDHVQKKLPYGYEYQGEHQVKNITNPIKVYKLLTAPDDAGKLIGMEPTVSASKWIWPTAVVTAVIVALIGYHVFQEIAGPKFEPASVKEMAYDLPDKPSIAVLPFDNMSGDPEQEYICLGLSEQIIASLSKVSGLFVIARNSSFSFKGKAVRVQQIAEELGVRYVLEGSFQKSEDKVRITAQLIDAITGHHLWAETYDRKLQDIFALQDEITIKILGSVGAELTKGERARVHAKGTDNLEAYIKVSKGFQHFERQGKEENILARKFAKEAIDIDPNYPSAWSLLGGTYLMDPFAGSTNSAKESWDNGVIAFQKALALDETYAPSHGGLAMIYGFQRKYEQALAQAQKGIALNPGFPVMHFGYVLVFVGRYEEAVQYFKKAIRHDPKSPTFYHLGLGHAYRGLEQYEDAIAAYKKALERDPDYLMAHIFLTATYYMAGRESEARAEAAEVLRLQPKFSVTRLGKILPYQDKEYLNRTLESMLKAGLPENPPLPLPDKPSIAVLPFDNLSGDPEQEYFSDGFTEDIITALSRTPKMLVIARNSTFTYKGRPVKVQQVGRDLGVHYVLEGSIRKVDKMVRTTAQLIDAKTGHHLWAGKYDREMKEIFALQDDLTKNIISAMQVELTEGEQARVDAKGTNNLEAYLKFLQARENILKLNAEGNALGKKMAQEAIELDPQFAMAYRVLAAGHRMDIFLGTSKSPKQSIGTCIKLLKKSIELDETYAEAYGALGFTYGLIGKHDEAITTAEKAISLDPNSANTYLMLGHTFRMADRPEDAIMAYTKAVRLNPLPPSIYFSGLGMSYSLAGQHEEAIKWCEKAVRQEPDSYIDRIFMIAVYSMAGRVEDARSEVPDLLRINPNFSLAAVEKRAKYKYKDKMIKALRKANLPE